MPTFTFLHLPPEKREKLVCAIKDEFTRVPFHEVSINKIVHAAGIPRGSFYQYFTDKNDMLVFILSEYIKQMLNHTKQYLLENGGDIFGMFYDNLEFAIAFATQKEGNSFFKNLFADIRVNTEFYLDLPGRPADMKMFFELLPYIDTEKLDLRAEDDLANMMSVLCSVCRDAMVEVFLNLEQSENLKIRYKQKLELLKRGFEKSNGKGGYSHART